MTTVPAALRRIPWAKLVRFVITGGTALALDLVIYLALTRLAGVPYLLARTISLSAAFGWNFTLNRVWTFRAQGGSAKRQAVRFVIVMTTTSLLQLGLMHVGVAVLHLPDLLVIGAVVVMITLINFFAHQVWTYTKR